MFNKVNIRLCFFMLFCIMKSVVFGQSNNFISFHVGIGMSNAKTIEVDNSYRSSFSFESSITKGRKSNKTNTYYGIGLVSNSFLASSRTRRVNVVYLVLPIGFNHFIIEDKLSVGLGINYGLKIFSKVNPELFPGSFTDQNLSINYLSFTGKIIKNVNTGNSIYLMYTNGLIPFHKKTNFSQNGEERSVFRGLRIGLVHSF